MVQITDANRPQCVKECGNPALTLYSGMWMCGECFAEYCGKQEKLKQKMILEG